MKQSTFDSSKFMSLKLFAVTSFFQITMAAWELIVNDIDPFDGNYYNCTVNQKAGLSNDIDLYDGIFVLGPPKTFGVDGALDTTVDVAPQIVNYPLQVRIEVRIYGYDSWSSYFTSFISITDLTTTDTILDVYLAELPYDEKSSAISKKISKDFVQMNSPLQIRFAQLGFLDNYISQSWGIGELKIYKNQCMQNCEQCVVMAVCLLCDVGYAQQNTFCFASCTGSTWKNTVTRTCDNCHGSCLTCSGPASNQCLSCYGTVPFDPTNFTCQCPQYTELLTQNCLPCDSTCATCSDTISCDTCKDGYYFQLGGPCLPCPEECLTCDISGNCLSCSSTKNRSLNGTTCACNSSYFERSLSLSYDASLTRSDYNTSNYGACIACIAGCVECQNEESCTKAISCSETRQLSNERCECKIEYTENLTTGECEKVVQAGAQIVTVFSEQSTAIASGAAAAALPSLAVGSPGLVLQAITIMQILRYLLFLNVKFPQIVIDFFGLFKFSDGSQLQSAFFEFDINKMRSSNGFNQYEIDALFLRNSLQMFKSLGTLGIAYFALKQFIKLISGTSSASPNDSTSTTTTTKLSLSAVTEKNKDPLSSQSHQKEQTNTSTKLTNFNAAEVQQVKLHRILMRENGIDPSIAETLKIQSILEIKNSKKEKILAILSKVVESFEWGMFLGNIEAAFLNVCTFCFLQLQNVSFTSIFQMISFFLAFFTCQALVWFLVKTDEILPVYNYQNSLISPEVETREPENNSIDGFERGILKFLQSYSLLFTLFSPGPLLKQGFYVVLAIRKFIFAFLLVFAYKQPFVIGIICMVMNLTLIVILLKYQPYKEPIHTFRDVVTEVLLCAVHFFTLPFSQSSFMDDSTHQAQYNLLGTCIIGCMIGILGIQFLSIAYDSLKQVKGIFVKEPPIPPTPIVPGTPQLSRISYSIINMRSSTSVLEEDMDKQFKDDYLQFEKEHSENMDNPSIRQDVKIVLEDIYRSINESKKRQLIQQYLTKRDDYKRYLFIEQVTVRLNELTKELKQSDKEDYQGIGSSGIHKLISIPVSDEPLSEIERNSKEKVKQKSLTIQEYDQENDHSQTQLSQDSPNKSYNQSDQKYKLRMNSQQLLLSNESKLKEQKKPQIHPISEFSKNQIKSIVRNQKMNQISSNQNKLLENPQNISPENPISIIRPMNEKSNQASVVTSSHKLTVTNIHSYDAIENKNELIKPSRQDSPFNNRTNYQSRSNAQKSSKLMKIIAM